MNPLDHVEQVAETDERDGKKKFESPSHPPGERQFQPNNSQIAVQTKDGVIMHHLDWATRVLLKERAPRSVRERAVGRLRGNYLFQKKGQTK